MNIAFVRRLKDRVAGAAAGCVMLFGLGAKAGIVVSNGQSVAFLGDAITLYGWQNPHGFVHLVVAGLQANGVKVTPLPAGVLGDNSDRMLARLKTDVLDKKPDWVVLNCGLTDIQPGTNGVPLARFKTNVASIVDQCQAARCKVLLLTATLAGEDLANAANQKLAGYNDALRSVAGAKKCPVADLNAMFQQVILRSDRHDGVLTVGGLFMNPLGDQLIAKGILQALGLDEVQAEKAEEAWLQLFIESPPPATRTPNTNK